MRLSIVPIDKTVCKDNLCYSNLTWEGTPDDVHALQWFETYGWIEIVDGLAPNTEITELPDWANNAVAAWDVANAPKPVPDPVPPTAADNKGFATYKLQSTDWTTIPDVSDPLKSNPYLNNASEFVSYRNKIRAIAINPVGGYIDWAIEPKPIWITMEQSV